MKHLLNLLIIFAFIHTANAQKYKFGKVSKAELAEKACPIDTSANACVLYKERYTHFDYLQGKGFVIKEDYFVRIKIYNKEGFDVATQSVPLYYDPHNAEQVMGLKGVTYNLVNGKIQKTKLDKKNIYIEKTSDHIKQYKFSMPNLQPGSVVEWKYTKFSPYKSNLDEVVLQYDIPVKKEKIMINIPEFYNYRPHIKGFLPINLNPDSEIRTITMTEKTRTGGGWTPSETNYSQESYDFKENTYQINMTDVPALKDEPYAGNIDNYRSSVMFELQFTKLPQSPPEQYATTWEAVALDAYNDSNFGAQLKKRNYLKETMAPFADKPNDIKKLIEIYELAKKKIKWNGKYNYYVDKGVAKAFKTGSGNVGDVNLNLINMLNAGGFEASPVLVSTVKQGIPLFPTRTGFNYVIAHVNVGGKEYLLDATDPYAIPNVLPERALNFQGRLIKKDGSSQIIELFPREYSNKLSKLNLKLEDDELSGMLITKTDRYFAYQYREKIASKSKDDIDKYLQEKYEEFDITNSRISNAEKKYKQMMEAVQFNTDSYVEEISGQLFISPLLNLSYESNPFKSDERKFPVFFNFPYIRSINVNFVIPDGYEVAKLPEAVVYTFGNNDGGYEYKIEQKGNQIVIVSNYVINRPIIGASKYDELRSFIDKVINKQKEKIVLKKK